MYQLQKYTVPVWNAKDPIVYDESQKAWFCDVTWIVDPDKVMIAQEVAGDGPYGPLPVPAQTQVTAATGDTNVIG
jgi:hypothetical protein